MSTADVGSWHDIGIWQVCFLVDSGSWHGTQEHFAGNLHKNTKQYYHFYYRRENFKMITIYLIIKTDSCSRVSNTDSGNAFASTHCTSISHRGSDCLSIDSQKSETVHSGTAINWPMQ